ncbi:MAG: type II toxin-antitoxin system VapB family antitoxin [Bacillales bacterium]|nr:type II toxin-antitoxin system VapB family antitoxin [Bacillales bacterium]
MRTTLILSDDLIKKAMEVTGISVKTEVIHRGLELLIQKNELLEILNFAGKLDLDIDIKKLRER